MLLYRSRGTRFAMCCAMAFLSSCDTTVGPAAGFDAGVDAHNDGPSSGPDLGPLSCKGTESFQGARSAMLSSCGGVGPLSCHQRAPFSGNLDLTAANAYRSLVNVAADIAPAKLRVRPGSSSSSFLVQKLTNSQATSEGNPMPMGEGIMWHAPDPNSLNTLRCWIENGALNN